jgi:phospholipase C
MTKDRHVDSRAGSETPYSRRRFLGQVGAAGATGIAAPVIGKLGGETTKPLGPRVLGKAIRTSPIKQIVVLCQENHSFDNYVGTYSKLPAGYGIPANYTKNSGVLPFHFTNLEGNFDDPNHDWTSTHAAYDGGKMDGFVSNGNGNNAMGYYESTDLPYYYSLLPKYTLCAGYHCGVLSETYPNRMVLYAGTSGGWTDNSAPINGSFTWPNITTLLAAHGITYANYNFHCPNDYSILSMWKNNYKKANMNKTATQFASDVAAGKLPQVTFMTDAPPYDEHPIANIQTGMDLIKKVIKTIQAGPQWDSTAILLTWDEGGGFFDHIAPQALDAFGSGIRVPLFVVSPLAKVGHVDTTYSDHASILKFIEYVFGLPTLASINSQFNTSTPNVGQGGGKPFPPRDGNAAISDLTQCFSVAV